MAGASASPSAAAEQPAAFSFSITPAANAKGLPVSAEIGLKLDGAEVTAVTLAEAGGGKVSGTIRDDGTSWVPSSPLKYGKKYTATVTASKGGASATQTTTFTTMGEPGNRVGTGLYLFDGKTYGVAMPVVVEFHPGVPKKDRASVQKRMFVSTDPPQPGRGTGCPTARRPITARRSTGSRVRKSPRVSRWVGTRWAPGSMGTRTARRPRRSVSGSR
ncbi:hypothetical protein Pflav_060340 [Phytohabitans flavus]|uniref:Bacterial Ig domain-containing protein n=1 Tax=Phytohabitans flavus TaxID=1076124 RepID=A0A6F8Y0J7_9ACTN|nr:hypothetical protein Pflav_060340 [Phytohabitans flavus]